MASPQVCPVVGTTNSVLPPSHPDVDLTKSGQTCPKVGATTDHHHNLTKHPAVAPSSSSPAAGDAQACPALRGVVAEPKSRQMDDRVCPVVGPVTTVLPPDHPSVDGAKDAAAECPVTKAKVAHHQDKVTVHPAVDSAAGVCPVTGAKQA
ncbi:hypothetical protein F4780DRAFT_778459 [Xylariomycetidae sp. FL0641]|nr:hypothetical protein F4780DRAFT_778459 [Xylariomycetidae sp. FL0641]